MLLNAQASTIDADWAAMSRVARDAAYNCGKAVADSAQIIDGWIKASAEFRAQNPKHLDLAYGPGERNKWDLFPAYVAASQAILFRGAGIDIVWPQLLAMVVIGVVFFWIAHARFRTTLARMA